MILVTGATGHFGHAAIQSLLNKGVEPKQISALIRNEQSATSLKELGINLKIGNYDDFTSLRNAFEGVEKLLFVSGNDLQNRIAHHQNVINAAKEAGVKQVVYTSFLRKNETDSSPLWIVANSHIQTEKWLKESGIDYTILRNNLYMDFLPGFIGENVKESGVLYVPAKDGKVGAVLRSEMAEAAASVLTNDGHAGKEYEITNSEAVSYQTIAHKISEVSGKEIQYISPSLSEYQETMKSYGVPTEVIGIFSSFADAQAQGELEIESSDLEKLLGRKPTSVLDFVAQVYSPKA